MAVQHVEIERKFDVGDAFVVPDLSGVPGIASVARPVEHELEAAYYDTADLRLARARVTLRRRTGGTDAGWHVKLPAAAGARQELQSPLGRAAKTPPKAVLEPVLGIIRRAPVAAVAVLQTRRVVTELLAEDGRVLAEVADDHVSATALPAGPGEAAAVTVWREVEVELVDGDETLLAAVGAELNAAGAEPSASTSKLTRALADRLVDPGVDLGREVADRTAPPPTAPVPTTTGKRKKGKKGRRKTSAAAPLTAGDVLRATLPTQLTALRDADLMIRTGQPDGVHQVRVACRRLRATLSAFQSILSREHTDALRAELRWVGTELAGSRDGEVALAHLRDLLAAQPPELVLGPVAARLQQSELQDDVAGSDRARRVLATPRYLTLLDALTELAAAPPVGDLADQPAGPVLAGALAKAGRRLRRSVSVVHQAENAGAGYQAGYRTADDGALHEVRKAAKRLRYTAELVAPVLGRAAADLLPEVKGVQEVLGARQDTVLTRALCTQLGLAAFGAGENAWTYGRLHALEQARAARAEQDFWARWPQLRRVLKAATSHK